MKIFHLSINADALVSLWDTANAAKRQTGETYIALQLTPQQERTINEAAKRATARSEGTNVSR